MGFFSKLFGRRTKEDLIRDLVKSRIKDDPKSEIFGVTPDTIDKLPQIMLMGLPEATIVTIAETYTLMKAQGVPEDEILEAIEVHRSSIGANKMPSPLSLQNYVKYRVAIEHSDGSPINEKFIDSALTEALRFFSQ